MVSYVIAVDSVLKLFCARLLVRKRYSCETPNSLLCWAWLPCYLPTCWCGIPQQSFSSRVLSWTKTPRSLLSLLLEIKCDSFIYGENSSAESPLRWRSSLLTGNVHMNFVEILLLTCHYLLSAWVKKLNDQLHMSAGACATFLQPTLLSANLVFNVRCWRLKFMLVLLVCNGEVVCLLWHTMLKWCND